MPTKRHTYTYPTRIEYGPGAVSDLVAIVQQAGYKRGLLVTDEGVVKIGSPEKISNNFKMVCVGLFYHCHIIRK